MKHSRIIVGPQHRGSMSATVYPIRVPRGTLRKTVGDLLGELMDELYDGDEALCIERMDNRRLVHDATQLIKALKRGVRVQHRALHTIRERRCSHCSHEADLALQKAQK